MSYDELANNSEPTALNNPHVKANSAPLPPQSNTTTWASMSSYQQPTILPPPPQAAHESDARERVRRRRVQSGGRGGEWAWVVIGFAMLGIVILIAMSVSLLLRTAQEDIEVIPTAAAILPTPLGTNLLAGDSSEIPVERVILNDGSSLALTPWNGVSRFTVLVMGLDRRPGETGLAYRTDTMLLVSIDPTTQGIGILSIPRDLYVEVPGYSELQRVNTPMVLGELRQPGFGPDLAMQTVQYNLGIRIHDFLAVDFNTFIRFIDSIGGIPMNVPYNISDPLYPDMNYGYDPFYIRAGEQVLDGVTALKYARTRHGDSDFQRAQRQQDVMYAIRDKILNPETLPQIIIQSPSIWASMSDGVYTGMTFEQIIQLGLYLRDIPADNIHTGVINELYTIPYSTTQGASVLVPDREKIGPLMVEVFGLTYSE